MARMLFLEGILPQIKVGFSMCECMLAVIMSYTCVTAQCYFYLPATVQTGRQFPHLSTDRREEAEYINIISKAEACVYCGTVLLVADGGFHSENLNVVFCLLSQAFGLIVFAEIMSTVA